MRPTSIQAKAVLAILASTMPALALPNLRILTLGDSITKGSGSSHGNGYRDYLRKMLGTEKAKVDMVGTLRDGAMKDNDHEGHSGKFLADIMTYWQKATAASPNVVLIHAGTNNMDLEVDLDTAPELYASILDGILKMSPYTTIIVSPIIWANDTRMQVNTDAFNAKLKTLVADRQKAGKHMLLAPASISSAADLTDKKHPNDRGYEKFADSWHSGIMDADERGWIQSPKTIDPNAFPGVGLGWHLDE